MDEHEEKNEREATDAGGASHSHDADATSKETLSDIEESEKVPASHETGSPTEGSSPGPTPDGSVGEGRADGSETGGPM